MTHLDVSQPSVRLTVAPPTRNVYELFGTARHSTPSSTLCPSAHCRVEPSVDEHFLKIRNFHNHSLSSSDFGYIFGYGLRGVSNDMFTCCIKLAFILSFIY